VVFSNCEATFGGAIHVKGPDAGNGGMLSISAMTQGKTITVRRNDEDFTETIQVGGVKFENCTSYKTGGAIYHGYYTGKDNNATKCDIVFPAATSIDGCYFDHCYAWTVSSREAYGAGGAICSYAVVLTVSDSYFDSCEVKAYNLGSDDVRGTHIGGGQGGAIYHVPDAKPGSSATITNSYFVGCDSESSGGTMESNALLFTVTGCVFDESKSNNGMNGGAISTWFGRQRPVDPQGRTFFEYDLRDANATLIVEGCKFYQCYSVTKAESGTPNESESEDEVYYGGNGGAIRSSSNRLEVKDCEFDDCHAFHGGAIFTTDRTEYVKIYGNTQFKDCYVPHTGSDVAAGTAGNGGAIYLNKKAGTNNVFEITGATFDGVADHHMNSNGMDAVRGGAIYLKGGNLKLDGVTFHDCHATLNGGAIYMDEGTTLEIGGAKTYFWECAANAEITDNDGKGNGGAIYSKSSDINATTNATVKIANAEFNGHKRHENESLIHLHDDVPNAVDGGAIYMKAGTLVIDGSTNAVDILNCTVGNGVIDSENPIINSGGALFLRENTTTSLTDTTIDGHATTTENGRSITYGSQYANATNGGAIYAKSGSTIYMTDGDVTRNTAVTDGAGVYLEQGARMNISGGLNFGGTDLVGGNGADKDDLKGTEGNFVLKGSNFKTGTDEPKNGGKDYPKDGSGNYKVRQDIYIKGYIGTTDGNPTPATSLNVTDVLKDPANSSKAIPEGSIWVWTEVPDTANDNNHYEQFKQFATFSSSLTADDLEDSVKGFRNSVDDERSQNGTDGYLTGTLEGDLTGSYIYWYGNNGFKKVILRKADSSDHAPLKDAKFDIYKGNNLSPYVVKDRNDKTITEELKDKVSKASGVLWIGTLPYGVYYVHEKTVPSGYAGSGSSDGRWFYMVVGDDPTKMSVAYTSRSAAKTAYDNEKNP
ncbi:MAG: hypothetical protein J6Y90_01250, partial [Lachnospiraceae bacterium]|nr:hypothetical protein [Lachnospiraceae bacterium]